MTNSSIPKGGRGHLAPYEQSMVRCPEPIKNGIAHCINTYRAAAMAQDWEKGDRIAAALEAFSGEEPVDGNDDELKRLRDLIDRWAEKSLTASATSRDWVQFRRFFDEYLVMSLGEVDDGNLQEVTGDVAAGDTSGDGAD